MAVAAARPDLSRQAYRYEVGSNENVINTPVITTSTSYQPTASGNSYYNSVPSVGQSTYTTGTAGFVPSTQITYATGGNNVGSSSSFQSTYSGNGGVAINDNIGLTGIHPGPAINYKEQEAYISHLANFQPAQITKHFYLHTAPEDHDEQQIVRYVNVGRPQKNYRVVFINAPASTASKAKIIANVAPVEDKTAIYVLSKKSNDLDVSAEVVTQAPVHNKPEVFFIKYKTPAEAAHAQQTIQGRFPPSPIPHPPSSTSFNFDCLAANYDALGGTSQLSDEGIVPVSSVINSLGDNGSSGVLTDAVGGVNIVGTGGVPLAESTSGSTGSGSISLQYDGSSSNNQATQITEGISGSAHVGNGIIQTTYLPAKPIRSVKY